MGSYTRSSQHHSRADPEVTPGTKTDTEEIQRRLGVGLIARDWPRSGAWHRTRTFVHSSNTFATMYVDVGSMGAWARSLGWYDNRGRCQVYGHSGHHYWGGCSSYGGST